MCACGVEVSTASGGIVREAAVVSIAGGVSRGAARAMLARARMTAYARMIVRGESRRGGAVGRKSKAKDT